MFCKYVRVGNMLQRHPPPQKKTPIGKYRDAPILSNNDQDTTCSNVIVIGLR